MKKYLCYTIIIGLLLASCSGIKKVNRSSDSSTIKVMTYNVHHCNPPSKSKAGIIDIDTIAATIRKQNPDIVALQEIDDHAERSGAFNQAEELGKKLGMHFYFGKAIDYGGGGYGVAILSKYAISDGQTIPLPSVEGFKGETRVVATVYVTLSNGTKIRFGTTHLEVSSEPNRELQIKEIARIASTEKLPFIIGGDFNSLPESNVIKTLDQTFTRTCVTGCPFTIPEINPRRTIDFIAFQPNEKFQVMEHKVIDEPYASDHLPVVSVLEIK